MHAIGSQWRHAIAPHIEQYLDYVNSDLGYPPSEERALELSRRLPINIYVQGPDSSFSTNGKTFDPSDIEFRRPGRHRKRRAEQRQRPRVAIGERHDRTVLRNRTGQYQIYYELKHRRPLARNKVDLWIPIAFLIAILAMCYFVMRRMLKPVHDIKHAVRAMGAGQLQTRVPVRSKNDLGVLASSINTMASDIEKLLNAKRQLLLGASHELRTPITRAKVATQLLEESANRDRIIEDLDEMESLIADIMESERVTGGHSVLNLSTVNVAELIQSVLTELRVPEVRTDIATELPVIEADEARLRLLLRNLVSNALEHGANPDHPPLISASNHGNTLTLAIADFGKGITTEHLHRLTEPFYRADPSRSRSTGGFGLGLHISELIVQAHGGTLSVASETDTVKTPGTTVTVSLPVRNNG